MSMQTLALVVGGESLPLSVRGSMMPWRLSCLENPKRRMRILDGSPGNGVISSSWAPLTATVFRSMAAPTTPIALNAAASRLASKASGMLTGAILKRNFMCMASIGTGIWMLPQRTGLCIPSQSRSRRLQRWGVLKSTRPPRTVAGTGHLTSVRSQCPAPTSHPSCSWGPPQRARHGQSGQVSRSLWRCTSKRRRHDASIVWQGEPEVRGLPILEMTGINYYSMTSPRAMQ
mmetsp:Transcript_16622/g.38910  ORF Transcript_16622/g.38910 Transcript_16622/m.38910 type:complete len:231 (-) Transcript_16622:68-760(-)